MESFFMNNANDNLSVMNLNIMAEKRSSELKKIIFKVHKHVCAHATFTNFKLLLERNGLWINNIQKYDIEILNKYPDCRTTAAAQSSRKVSISSLSKKLNDIVCLDHFYFDDTLLIHFLHN